MNKSHHTPQKLKPRTKSSQQHKIKKINNSKTTTKRLLVTTTRHSITPNHHSLATISSHNHTHHDSHPSTLNHAHSSSSPSSPSSSSSSSSPLTQSRRQMWFIPDDSFKGRLKRAVVNTFNLAPPPPSVNLEEFALLSKMFNVIIDCRSEEQRIEGRIPKSVHIPLSTMTRENRENMGIQFARLTVLVYDQNGSTVDSAAAYLRDCGAESWSLEGGADAFKDFVAQTRAGTYTRRVTLEEAQQHVFAQSRAGARLPRKYDPNRVIESFDSFLDENQSGDDDNKDTPKHTIAINPTQYNRKQEEQQKQEILQVTKQKVDV